MIYKYINTRVFTRLHSNQTQFVVAMEIVIQANVGFWIIHFKL